MEESATYQAIIERGEVRGEMRGRASEARRLIEQIGSKRFGTPSASVLTQLAALTSAEDLERLAGKLLDVENWNKLLS